MKCLMIKVKRKKKVNNEKKKKRHIYKVKKTKVDLKSPEAHSLRYSSTFI